MQIPLTIFFLKAVDLIFQCNLKNQGANKEWRFQI